MEYKVSVVIPMYKARDYIVSNVNALLKQTIPELEVIVVNDCTPDDSMELCRDAFGDNPRVQLIDQPHNAGPGEARNAGIKVARGEYVAFADADDGVLPEAYGKMYQAAVQNHADVLHCTGAIYPLVKNPPVNLLQIPKEDLLFVPTDRCDIATDIREISKDKHVRLADYLRECYQWNVWNKLYRREFLINNDIRFGKMRVGEDQVFCFACLMLADTYVLMPGEFYIYRIAQDSLSRGANRMGMLLKALTAMLDMPPMIEEIFTQAGGFEEDEFATQTTVKFIADNLELIFIRPSFQEIGEEAITKDGQVLRVFQERFQENANYVYYAFLEQHHNYPKVDDILRLISDIDFLKANKDKFGKPAL